MKLNQAIQQALAYANNFSIQHAGITRDKSVVTTLECIRYQKKRDNLLLYIDGNWRMENHKNGSAWRQGEPLYHWFWEKQ